MKPPRSTARSRLRMFRDITVPLLRPVTAFVVTIGLIGTFQVFDQIWVMSEGNNGGPFRTTTHPRLPDLPGRIPAGARASAMPRRWPIVLFLIILMLYFIQRRIDGEDEAR